MFKHIFSRGFLLGLARVAGWVWLIFWFVSMSTFLPLPLSTLRFHLSAPALLAPGARQSLVLYLFDHDTTAVNASQVQIALRRSDGRWLGPWQMSPEKAGVFTAEVLIPAEASEGTVEPWLSLAERPFVALPGAMLQIRRLPQMAVVPPATPPRLGDLLPFRIAVLDGVTGAGTGGIPVQARVIDPSGITVIKREVPVGFLGTGEFSCQFHARSRPGTYRFEFSAGDRRVNWEIPVTAAPGDKLLDRGMKRFLRAFVPVPWWRDDREDGYVTKMRETPIATETSFSLSMHKEPRLWVFTSSGELDRDDIWEGWFRNRLLMTTGLGYGRALRAEIERTGDRTGIMTFSRWNARDRAREGQYLFTALSETGPARDRFRELAQMINSSRSEVYRALLNPGSLTSVDGLIYSREHRTLSWIRKSGRWLCALMGLGVGLFVLFPAFMPQVGATQLAGWLLLSLIVHGRQMLPNTASVWFFGCLFVACFWPRVWQSRSFIPWHVRNDGFWSLSAALICFWGVLIPVYRWYFRPIDGFDPSPERLLLFTALLTMLAIAVGEWPARSASRWRAAASAWWFRRETLLIGMALVGWHLLFNADDRLIRVEGAPVPNITSAAGTWVEVTRMKTASPDEFRTTFAFERHGISPGTGAKADEPDFPLIHQITRMPGSLQGTSRFYRLNGKMSVKVPRVSSIRVFQNERDFIDRLLRRVGSRKNRMSDLAMETLVRMRRFPLLEESSRRSERILLEGLAAALAREERLQMLPGTTVVSREQVLCRIFQELSRLIFVDQPLMVRFCGLKPGDDDEPKSALEATVDLLERGVDGLAEQLEDIGRRPEIFREGGSVCIRGAGGRGDRVFPLKGETLDLKRGRAFPDDLEIIGIETSHESAILIEIESLPF